MIRALTAVLLLTGWLFSTVVQAEVRSGITVEATALREAAGAAAPVLQQLPAQSRLSILKRQGGWYQVQTSAGQQGWVALLAVRFDKSAAAKGGNIGALLESSTAVAPATGVATGVRGVSDDQLEAGGAGSQSLQELDRYAVTPGSARAFAQSGGLRSQTIAYPN
ncbi:SH3 domain-containing protein [Pseudomonas sp. J452]|uniref:SH3 domain-containing protein n=1 Tax=Pseudomonas sp. J452 TaxID=2898441 RepID=UPI0021AE2811|nr:SH3 domain-containing protein [Pseudomonas sp. J452]UUY09852.1 SH3 domain-containing protein [Pseudomonas sp. J452]